MKQAGTTPDLARCALPGALLMRAASILLSGFACLAPPLHATAQIGSPAGPVPVDLLEHRRAALLDAVGNGIAIIRSAHLRDIEADYPQDSDYRENNDFFYLTGIEAPGSYLVLSGGASGRGEAVLYMPPRDPREEQWTGPKLGPGPEATRLTGIAKVYSMERIRPELDRMIAEAPAVYVQLANGPVCGGRSLCAPALEELGLTVDDPSAVAPLTAALRLIKDADELRRLRTAIDITAEAQREAMRAVRPGSYEYELEAVIEYTFRRRGAERVGFPSIVGSGPNSVTLHYDRNRRRTEAGDLVVVDIGAEFGYYTADVTRTIPVSGRFTDRQRAIYDLVLGAQQAAIDAVKPGITVAELNRIARDWIERNSGNLCGDTSCNRYFVHGLSHWLGMDVHDVGEYQRPLEEGMVLTVEPGIYIASENLGVRIEDDVLVTVTGHEILSAAAPRTAADVEREIASRANTNETGRPQSGTAG